MKSCGVPNVLLIFTSVFSKIEKRKLVENIRRTLLNKRIRIFSLADEDNFMVLDVSDLITARSELIGMLGIEKVAIARETYNNFASLVNAICAIGQEIIMPKEKFVIKVKLCKTESLDYKERDIEFASTGELASKLFTRGARPARAGDTVDRTIQAYVLEDRSYVCTEVSICPGGMPFDSRHHKVICCIHSWLSALSCMASMRSGFRPEILLPYHNEEDLRNKLKLSKSVLNMINKKRYTVSIAQVVLPTSLTSNIELLVLESIYYRLLASLPGDVVLVSLTTAIFPTWYVNMVINDVFSAGKIPWTPLIFMSPETNEAIPSLGYFDSNQPLQPVPNQGSYDKHSKMITEVSRAAIGSLKRISFKIGSNYIHDIIDAI